MLPGLPACPSRAHHLPITHSPGRPVGSCRSGVDDGRIDAPARAGYVGAARLPRSRPRHQAAPLRHQDRARHQTGSDRRVGRTGGGCRLQPAAGRNARSAPRTMDGHRVTRLVGVDGARDPQPDALPPRPPPRTHPRHQADRRRHRRRLLTPVAPRRTRQPAPEPGHRAPGSCRAPPRPDPSGALGVDLAQPRRSSLTTSGRASRHQTTVGRAGPPPPRRRPPTRTSRSSPTCTSR